MRNQVKLGVFSMGTILCGGRWLKLCQGTQKLSQFSCLGLIAIYKSLAPGFSTPPNMDYMGYHSYISDNLPPESPVLYGLHPNAEIGFLTSTSETLFRTVFELQPREGMV